MGGTPMSQEKFSNLPHKNVLQELGSSMIFCVDRHIILGQIAGPYGRQASSGSASQLHFHFGSLKRVAGGGRIKRNGPTIAKDNSALQRKCTSIWIEWNTRKSRGRHDS